MKNWIDILLRTEDAREMQREYKLLIAAGMPEDEAEDEVISYFISDATAQGILWISFALIQWNLGRISEKVYCAAKQQLNAPLPGIPSEAVSAIAAALNSPMPDRKPINKPRTIKCPWKEGALLAYRITTQESVRSSRFWGKYVLLRVVKIKKWPLSAIKPDLWFDESMYVALYNWVGASVPAAGITESLKYTYISVSKPLAAQFSDRTYWDKIKSAADSARWNVSFDAVREEYVYALDWGKRKETAAVFTHVGNTYNNEDISFLDNLEGPKAKIPPLISAPGFDIVLTKRLEQLFPEDCNEDL